MGNPITPVYDPSKLNEAQADGLACITCGRDDQPMKPVDVRDGVQLFECTSHVAAAVTPSPKPAIPPTVRERAEQAGRDAVKRFRHEYESAMAAHEHERTANENGDVPPAAWLAEDHCPPWCVDGCDHSASTHPDDRIHFGASTIVPLVTMEPVVVCYPERFAPPELMISLDQKYREKEPRVSINDGGDKLRMFATLDEAEQIANAMLAHVAAARGRAHRTGLTQVYDGEGRCPDLVCLSCYPIPAQRVAETA